MRRSFRLASIAAAVLLLTCLVASEPGRAARSVVSLFTSPTRYEILVFEKNECRYCEVFRADIASRYKDMPQASKMPMRFLDVEKVDIGAFGLKGALRLVPTAVVMRDGVEVDRIQGLTSARNFLLLLQHITGPLD